MQGYAIVGMACRYPGIKDTASYWQRLVKGECLLGEMKDQWAARYYNKNQDRSNPRESYSTIYTKKYGSIANDSWIDSIRFAFPPNLIEGDPSQYLCLQVAAEAVADALRGRDESWIPHDRSGVIVGMGDHPHRGIVGALMNGMLMEHFIDLLADTVGAVFKGERRKQLRSLLSSTYELAADPAVTPNLISNVVSGTVANRLGLMGPNYLVDGACTSGMIAIDHAIKELDSGDSDLMLVGGVQATMNFPIYQLFCTLNALSETDIFPMSRDASGTLLSEGVGFLVIKRLADAIATGDTIYSVIRSVGLASDGKGEGLLAPNRLGQIAAMNRAYQKSGLSPSDISLIEVHATGIPHGDNTELSSMLEVFGEGHKGLATIALGSIKSLIGHTIPASGVASIIKVSLALQNKLIPATICPNPIDCLADHSSPFYINRSLRRWFHSPARPRLAAINSFGFGGINGHLLLEEYPGHTANVSPLATLFPYQPSAPAAVPPASPASEENPPAPKLSRTYRNLLSFVDHGYTTTGRAVFFESVSRQELLALLGSTDVGEMQQSILVVSGAPGAPSGSPPCRLVVFASGVEQLAAAIQDASAWLAANPDATYQRGRSFIYSAAARRAGKIAFLVPGEGVQSPEMLSDLTTNIDLFAYWYNFMDEALARDVPLGLVACLPNADLEVAAAAKAVRYQMMYAQDTATQLIAACLMAFYEIASRIGLKPDQIVGHSQGESNAVMLSGSLATMRQESDLKARVQQIHQFFSQADSIDEFPAGATFAVSGLTSEQLEEILERRDEWSLISDNCRSQRIVFTEAPFAKELEEAIVAVGGALLPTPLTRPYHTKYFVQGADTHRRLYESSPHTIRFEEHHAAVYSCLTAKPYPNDLSEGTRIFVDQWTNPVRYESTIRNMYADGARYFIELGPNTTLTSYTKEALADCDDVVAVSLGSSRKDSTGALIQAVSTLWVSGVDLDLEALDALFIQRYRTGLTQVSRPKNAVPVLSEIPLYNSVGLREFLSAGAGTGQAELPASPLAPLPSPAPAPPLPVRGEAQPQNGVLATTVSVAASAAGGLASPDSDEAYQLLREHTKTILELIVNTDSATKQYFSGPE